MSECAEFPPYDLDWQCACGQSVPQGYAHSHGRINGESFRRIWLANEETPLCDGTQIKKLMEACGKRA